MREILFRGQRKDNGEWVFGTLYQIAKDLDPFIMVENKHGSSYAVDDGTVGQYTGLTDKNGEKIFEGDIVKRFLLGMEIIYWIKYECEYARFIGEALNIKGFTTFDCDGEMFEKIGNIYEIPELLEG